MTNVLRIRSWKQSNSQQPHKIYIYLGINQTKEVKHIYDEKLKKCKKETEEDMRMFKELTWSEIGIVRTTKNNLQPQCHFHKNPKTVLIKK